MKIRFQVENNGIVIGAGVIDIDEAINVGGGVGLADRPDRPDSQTIAHKIAIQDILSRVVTLEHELKELKLQKFEEIYNAIKNKNKLDK